MFKKAKSFCRNAVSKVKNAFNTAQAIVAVKAHEVLDGTAAEAYTEIRLYI